MPRILKRDEVERIDVCESHHPDVETDMKYTDATLRRLIAAMTEVLKELYPTSDLVALGTLVAAGTFDEHDAAALGRWEEMNGMGGGK